MNKEQLINKVVKSFTDKFGEKSAGTLSSAFTPENVLGFIPTGNLIVDWCIGRRGIPLGRITELSGPYGSGKSSICAATIGAAQKKGIVCVLFDIEHSYSSDWSRLWGVDPEELILAHPQHLQEMFDQVRFTINLIKKEQPTTPIFIVVDSVSATPTAEEIEEEDSTSGKQRGQHARVIGEGLRKIGDLIWNRNTALLFVSQLKDNPGITYGTGKHKLGGHAIEFHAGLMLEVRRQAYLKNKDESVYGQRIEVRAVKNKFVPPFRSRTFDLYYNEGIRPKEMVLDFLSDPALIGMITQRGGWYEYQGAKYRKEDLSKILDDSLLEKTYVDLGITTDVSPNREKLRKSDDGEKEEGKDKSETEKQEEKVSMEFIPIGELYAKTSVIS